MILNLAKIDINKKYIKDKAIIIIEQLLQYTKIKI